LDFEDRLAVVVTVALFGHTDDDLPGDDGASHIERMRLVSVAGLGAAVAFGFCFVFGPLVRLIAEPGSWFLVLIAVLLGISVAGVVMACRRSVPPTAELVANGASAVLTFLLILLVFAGIGLAVTVIVAFATLTLNMFPIASFMVLAWPMSAAIYLAWSERPAVGELVFPFPYIIRRTYVEARAKLADD
jgi:hypothetical protein